MYLLGYSLNNLTLMALTISTGFVVDDAIVMIENVVRYIEDGDKPLQAALKGAEQIGFTIVSLTISLIAVLIPLLFMGDIVGRLFREFAVTLSVTILVSAVVSLTLTPMLCSKLLREKTAEKQGRFYRASERVFQKLIDFYGATLRWVLKYRTRDAHRGRGNTRADSLALHRCAERVLSRPGHGCHSRNLRSAAEHFVSRHGPKAAGPGASRSSRIRRSRVFRPSSVSTAQTRRLNSGRILINLKPLDERQINASDVIRRLQPRAG